MHSLKPIVAVQTDIGLRRKGNEDAVFATLSPTNDAALLLVADGMGGSRNGKWLGKIAGQLLINTIYQELRDLLGDVATGKKPRSESIQRFSDDYLVERLHVAFQKANAVLYEHQSSDNKHLATSAIICGLVQNNQAVIANSDDCRAYLFREGQLRLITNNWPYAPKPTPDFVHLHYGTPFGFGFEVRVTQCAPGDEIVVTPEMFPFVNVYVRKQPLRAEDWLLFCTDGLWGEVEETEIEACLSQATSPTAAVAQLIEAAKAHGGHDNIGVGVCQMVAHNN